MLTVTLFGNIFFSDDYVNTFPLFCQEKFESFFLFFESFYFLLKSVKNRDKMEKNERELTMKKFIEEFKKFALRGNVLDMAVGIIVGGAFTAIVTSLTQNFIQPLLTVILTWGWKTVTLAGIGEAIASFLSAVINFLLTALVLFLLLKGVNTLMSLGKKKEAPPAPKTKKCPFCKSDIAIDATRCPHCTSQIEE